MSGNLILFATDDIGRTWKKSFERWTESGVMGEPVALSRAICADTLRLLSARKITPSPLS